MRNELSFSFFASFSSFFRVPEYQNSKIRNNNDSNNTNDKENLKFFIKRLCLLSSFLVVVFVLLFFVLFLLFFTQNKFTFSRDILKIISFGCREKKLEHLLPFAIFMSPYCRSPGIFLLSLSIYLSVFLLSLLYLYLSVLVSPVNRNGFAFCLFKSCDTVEMTRPSTPME